MIIEWTATAFNQTGRYYGKMNVWTYSIVTSSGVAAVTPYRTLVGVGT